MHNVPNDWHPAWCARPTVGCTGGHRSRPSIVDRGGVLVRVGLLARLGESGTPWVELVLARHSATLAVELTARDADLIGAALIHCSESTK